MKSRITITFLAVLTLAGCNSEQSAAPASEAAGISTNLNIGQEPQQPVAIPPATGNIIDELISAIEHVDELPHEEIATSAPETEQADAPDLTNEDDWVEPEVGSWSVEISGAVDPVPETCESILERLEI